MDAPTSTHSRPRLTQAEFFDWVEAHAEDILGNVELIHGRIVMTPPAGLHHGGLVARLCILIGNYVGPRRVGQVYASSADFDLPSGDTLDPDVSFVSNERLAATPTPPGRFGRAVPDLVVEIASPSTARRDRTVKKAIYAANSVREYWIVDPRKRAITVFHLEAQSFDAGTVFTSGAASSAILPGLAIPLNDVFD